MTQASKGSNLTITIVIVSYNSASDIRMLLSALEVRPDHNLEIVVIDNMSRDEDRVQLQRLWDERKLNRVVYNNRNLGFARAVNIGIPDSAQSDVLILNPDVRVTADTIVALADAVRADSKVGLGAPVVASGPSVAVMSAGRLPRIWPLFCHFSGLARLLPGVQVFEGRHLYLKNHASRDRIVEWASGCCLFVPRTTIELAGVLSERWFMYGEDIEYCHRVRSAGLSIKVYAGLTCHHQIGAAERSPKSPVFAMWPQNTFDFYRTTYNPNPLSQFVWRAIFCLGLFTRAAVLCFVIPVSKDRRSCIKRAFSLYNYGLAVWRTSSGSVGDT